MAGKNIRELENLLERATLLIDHQQDIKLSSLFPQLDEQEHKQKTVVNRLDDLLADGFSLDQYEQEIIMTAMNKCKQNVSEAARVLGISRATLDYRLKKMVS